VRQPRRGFRKRNRTIFAETVFGTYAIHPQGLFRFKIHRPDGSLLFREYNAAQSMNPDATAIEISLVVLLLCAPRLIEQLDNPLEQLLDM
jgi:hypothetical protein